MSLVNGFGEVAKTAGGLSAATGLSVGALTALTSFVFPPALVLAVPALVIAGGAGLILGTGLSKA